MAQGDDVTPGPALAGRLLRALGLPLQQRGYHHHHHHHHRHQHYHSSRRHGVSASGSDAIALELVAWPSSPAVTEPTTLTSTAFTTTTDGSTAYGFDFRECDFPQPTNRHRFSQPSLDTLQGHTRANSLDSTTSSSSTASSVSSPSPTSRSRWEKFGQDEFVTADRNAKHVEARRRKESTELWREYW